MAHRLAGAGEYCPSVIVTYLIIAHYVIGDAEEHGEEIACCSMLGTFRTP